MINTLAIAERLEHEGFSQQQAKALAEQFYTTSSDLDLATKKDLAELKTDLIRTLVTWQLINVAMVFGTYALIVGLYLRH